MLVDKLVNLMPLSDKTSNIENLRAFWKNSQSNEGYLLNYHKIYLMVCIKGIIPTHQFH